MRESLQFESCPAADGEWTPQQRLKGDNHILPAEGFMAGLCRRLRRRPSVNTPRELIEPAMGDVFIPQTSGIAVLFQPAGVHDQTFRKGPLQPV